MSEATDFQSLLEKPLDAFQKPKPTPEGNYIFGVKEFNLVPSQDPKKSPYVEFTFVPKQPQPDVDEALVAEWLDGNPITSKIVKKKFFITPDALFRLTDFATHCGVDIAGMSVSQVLQSCPGKEFLGAVKHSIGQKDPSQIYAEVATTAAVPEV